MKIKPIIRRYDNPMYYPLIREYYGHSDFFNFGYWLEETCDQKGACENLMEKLLTFISKKEGTILDIACGLGATTRHLLRYFSPSEVVGINVSMKQLETCKANAPDCTFLLMDAVKMGFEDNAFNNVICVEAAFHFDTREDFLGEVYRVLKPGGHLVLSDILVTRWAARLNPRLPVRNCANDLGAYKDVYMRVGFQDVEVVDATTESWKNFSQHLRRWRHAKLIAKEIDLFSYARMVLLHIMGNIGLRNYLLVSARKA